MSVLDCSELTTWRKTIMADYNDEYTQRTSEGANLAETKCVEFLKAQSNLFWYKFGFDEQTRNIPVNYFSKIPETLRNMPDYVCIKHKSFFLECKGYKHFLKIKNDDLSSYRFWANVMDLYFFAFDCVGMKHHILSLNKLLNLIEKSDTGRYPDNNKLYYKVKI